MNLILHNQSVYKQAFRMLILWLAISSTAWADDDGYPAWSVKGFGTLGFARSDNNEFGFLR